MINQNGAITSSAKFDKAFYRYINGRNLIILSVLFLWTVAGFAITLCCLHEDDALRYFRLIFCAVCMAVVGLLIVVLIVSVCRTLHRAQDENKTNVVELYENFMQVTEYEGERKISAERCPYETFVKVRETGKYFLAYVTEHTLHPVSKEGLTQAECNTARRLLRLKPRKNAGQVQVAYGAQAAPAAQKNAPAAEQERADGEARRTIRAQDGGYDGTETASFRKGGMALAAVAFAVGAAGLAAYLVLTVFYSVVYEETPAWSEALVVFAVPFTVGLIFLLTARQQRKAAQRNAGLVREYEFFSDCFVMREYRDGVQTGAVRFGYGQIIRAKQKGAYLLLYYLTMSVFYPVDVSPLGEAERNTLKKLFGMPLESDAPVLSLIESDHRKP